MPGAPGPAPLCWALTWGRYFTHLVDSHTLTIMTQGLRRFQASGQTHFVTFGCYHHLPNLNDGWSCRDFLATLESARRRFGACVYGFVLMPEHVHLLLSEPESGTLADLIRAVKLVSAKRVRRLPTENMHVTPFWQQQDRSCFHNRATVSRTSSREITISPICPTGFRFEHSLY